MKDLSTKVSEDDSKVDARKGKLEKVNNIDETDETTIAISSSEPAENDDIDQLVNDVKELNIKPGNVDTKDKEELVERGPTGGVAVPYFTEKNLPINPYGNYGLNPGFVSQPKDNGRHDLELNLEDCPRKFRRPTEPPQQAQFFQPQRQGGFSFNDLNAPANAPPFNMDFQKPVYTCNPLTKSGGKVVVQSPQPNAFSIADNLLDSMSYDEPQNMPKQHGGQYPADRSRMYPMPAMSTQEENVLSPTPSVCSVNMRSPINDRRPSDPLSDSGVESAEEKSPYSDAAPSPTGSNYSCPPSVESGYGRSPQHEPGFGQTNIPMSSPKYPGIMSPVPNNLAPSPASSAGYYSPMQQTRTDEYLTDTKRTEIHTEEFFANPQIAEILQDAYDVIQSDMDNQNKRLPHASMFSNTPPCPVTGNHPANLMRNQPVLKQPINYQQPGIPVQMVPSTTPIPANILPTTVTTSAAPPGSFIILQQNPLPVPNSNAPVILVTQMPKSKPVKPVKPRKILPKTSTAVGSTTSSAPNAGVITTTSPSNRTPNIMALREGGLVANRNGPQQISSAQAQRNHSLLMIARRTVAEMTCDELKKSDEEGDTYLHIAVCKTDKHMVQALLERLRREGLDNLVDQENNKRQTPLYLAVYINQPVMVAMFIKFQANVNVLAQSQSSDGTTREVKAAIHVAASQGHEYVDTLQQLLLAKDISINIVNNYGQTALHCAISAHNRVKRNSEERINSINIIKLLIKAGADASAQDQKSGKTPLMYAIEQRDYMLVETILSCIEPSKMRNVVRTQAFDGSSCLKIAEGLKDSYNVPVWNKLWNSLQSAASGSMRIQSPVF